MKLIEFLTTGKQIRTIPDLRFDLLGETEALKARLWVRLNEWEEMERVVFAGPPGVWANLHTTSSNSSRVPLVREHA